MPKFISHPRTQLFLVSLVILYFELILIRFIPAYVRYLGYFTNFILLGSFLGIGLGCQISKSKRDWSVWFMPLLLVLVALVYVFRFEIQITTTQAIFFQSNREQGAIESFFLIPVAFILITLLFTTLAQKLGRLLSQFPPLTGYFLDITGSLTGIVLFTLGAYLRLTPLVWFGATGIILLLILAPKRGTLFVNVFCLVTLLTLLTGLDDLPLFWSPYQKISVYSVSNPKAERNLPYNHWRLYVNNISHQEMTPYEKIDSFYKLHYQEFGPRAFSTALVVGSGSGQDVAVALANEVTAIDAVEIDPLIAELGKKLHPERPYSDSRVKLYTNDARSYLENTEKKYDLIIYALPDSTILSTTLSSLRLESYLFTLEAFNEVKKHLTPDGLFVLYNYYRESWLIDKIALMLEASFGQKPYIFATSDNLAVFMVGAKTAHLSQGSVFTIWQGENYLKPATDDWPFLYLKDASIPRVYLKSLLAILAIAMLLVLWVNRSYKKEKFGVDFFFLGAAFLLIETKSIINFNLLFGATWLVNSLVFIGILTSVLLAIIINQRFLVKRIEIWGTLLIVSLLMNYFLPLKFFLSGDFWLRFVFSTVFFFSPIFFANIVFSALFKRVGNVAQNFGANLIGAFIGGLSEYISLVLGYHNLILVAALFYLVALIFIRRRLILLQRI